MRSEFAERYMPGIIAQVGSIIPEGYPGAGRRLDWSRGEGRADASEDGFRQDAGESAFLERQLELIEGKVYEYKLRELKYRRLFPISGEGKGAETIGYDIIRGTGIAKIIASGSQDIPRADTFVDRQYAQVKVLAISFGYTTRELRNAAFANVPLEARRASAARRGMEEKLSKLAWFGDAQYNMLGITNNPNIPQVAAATAAGGGHSAVWGVDKTAVEVAADLANAITDVIANTNEIHKPDTLAMPVAKLEYLRRTPMSSTYPQMTIYKWITDASNGFGITTIEGVPELKGAGPEGTDMFYVYEKSDENMQFRIPMEMQAMAPEQRNLEFLINMEAECAGMVVRYPLSGEFVYGI